MVAQAFTGAGEGGRAAAAHPSPAPPRRAAPSSRSRVSRSDVLDTLRAPLAAIREYVWFMVAGPDGRAAAPATASAAGSSGAAQQMTTGSKAGRVRPGRSGGGPVESVPVAEVIEVSLCRVERDVTASGARLRVVVTLLPVVLADRVLLTYGGRAPGE